MARQKQRAATVRSDAALPNPAPELTPQPLEQQSNSTPHLVRKQPLVPPACLSAQSLATRCGRALSFPRWREIHSGIRSGRTLSPLFDQADQCSVGTRRRAADERQSSALNLPMPVQRHVTGRRVCPAPPWTRLDQHEAGPPRPGCLAVTRPVLPSSLRVAPNACPYDHTQSVSLSGGSSPRGTVPVCMRSRARPRNGRRRGYRGQRTGAPSWTWTPRDSDAPPP